MSVNLWWAMNDGMTGHVWLGPHELRLISEEMLLQGMAESFPLEKLNAGPGAERVRITPQEIEGALAVAEEEPTALGDRKLWGDWLEFLDGARHKGGLLVG